jgi:hypothetical protein
MFQIENKVCLLKIVFMPHSTIPKRLYFWKPTYGSMLMYGFCYSWTSKNIPTCKFTQPWVICKNLLSHINESFAYEHEKCDIYGFFKLEKFNYKVRFYNNVETTIQTSELMP